MSAPGGVAGQLQHGRAIDRLIATVHEQAAGFCHHHDVGVVVEDLQVRSLEVFF